MLLFGPHPFYFLRINFLTFQTLYTAKICKGDFMMKATGIVRRIDDLGRVVIPKEIRRTMRIREGDPLLTTSTLEQRYIRAIAMLEKRCN